LIDNGEAPLHLASISPKVWGANEAAPLTLTLSGAGFTPNSVVRWGGSNRPTTFISSTRLSAAISAADVSVPGNFAVSVYDPEPPPSGTITPALTFRVFASLSRLYLPGVLRPIP
jgi:hypothetical protein